MQEEKPPNICYTISPKYPICGHKLLFGCMVRFRREGALFGSWSAEFAGRAVGLHHVACAKSPNYQYRYSFRGVMSILISRVFSRCTTVKRPFYNYYAMFLSLINTPTCGPNILLGHTTPLSSKRVPYAVES